MTVGSHQDELLAHLIAWWSPEGAQPRQTVGCGGLEWEM